MVDGSLVTGCSEMGILHDKSKVIYTLLILYFGSEI
jgi:hypothetical protein